MNARNASCLVACCLGLLAFSCSAGGDDASFGGGGAAGAPAGTGGMVIGGTGGTLAVDAAMDGPAASNCAASAKLSYVVSRKNELYSFNPDESGLAAYSKIGTLSCPTSSSPQAMSVSRSGKAYVFYDSGEMFLVDMVTVACSATPYKHPASGFSFTLGLGFTSDTDGAQTEGLFAASPDVGLYTIDPDSFATSLLNVHKGVAADMTGGPDAKLFYWQASNKTLFELDRANGFAMSPLHQFATIKYDIQAWALTRFAGVFYMFTAGYENTMTTRYDPSTNEESTRDADIGFRVVGAGQSTCVPPPLK